MKVYLGLLIDTQRYLVTPIDWLLRTFSFIRSLYLHSYKELEVEPEAMLSEPEALVMKPEPDALVMKP